MHANDQISRASLWSACSNPAPASYQRVNLLQAADELWVREMDDFRLLDGQVENACL